MTSTVSAVARFSSIGEVCRRCNAGIHRERTQGALPRETRAGQTAHRSFRTGPTEVAHLDAVRMSGGRVVLPAPTGAIGITCRSRGLTTHFRGHGARSE